MTPHKLKADLAIIQSSIKELRQDLATALDVETDLKIKIYIEETGLNVGDKVDVYMPVGEPPYQHETRIITHLIPDEGLAILDDGSSVGIGYLTLKP